MNAPCKLVDLLVCVVLGPAVSACTFLAATPETVPAAWQTPAATPAEFPTATTGLPTADAVCVNAARFLEDLTVPDASVIAPGAVIDKRWSVQNTGTCDWGPDYRLAPVDAGGFEGANPIALYPARAGEQAVWQVEVRAPLDPGEHVGTWQAVAPDGTRFGDLVFLLVEVAP